MYPAFFLIQFWMDSVPSRSISLQMAWLLRIFDITDTSENWKPPSVWWGGKARTQTLNEDAMYSSLTKYLSVLLPSLFKRKNLYCRKI